MWLRHYGDRVSTDREEEAIFDIVWNVKVKKEFSRSLIGELQLRVNKDRDSVIPKNYLDIVIGGTPFQFEVTNAARSDNDLSSDEQKTFDLVAENSRNRMGTRRKEINQLFDDSKSRAAKTIDALLKGHLIYQDQKSKHYWTLDSMMDSPSNPESPESPNQDSNLDSSEDKVNREREGVPGSGPSGPGPMDPAPHPDIGPDDPLEETTEGENDNESPFPGDRNANSRNVLAIDSVTQNVRAEDVLEEIETLDFPPRGIKALKAVASVYLDHPMLTVTTLPHMIEKDKGTVIRLSEKKGIRINSYDFDKADSILRKNSVFVAAINKRIKKLFDPRFNIDYEGVDKWYSKYDD